jgi:hypothetical protein
MVLSDMITTKLTSWSMSAPFHLFLPASHGISISPAVIVTDGGSSGITELSGDDVPRLEQLLNNKIDAYRTKSNFFIKPFLTN